MPPCGPTAERSIAKPTSPAIAATTLSSRALPECCRTVLSGSAPHLSRAHHTAEALWRSGYFNENEAAPPLRSVPEFAEQHLGEWRGLDRAPVAPGGPAMAASYWYAPADERPAGGESFADVCARVRVAVDRLNPVYFEKRSFSSSGSRRSLTQRRSAMMKGSRFRRASKSATRRVRSSALAWQW